MQVNMLEAKNRLSKLVKLAVAGEEVIIASNGEPQVRLVPCANPPGMRATVRLIGKPKPACWQPPSAASTCAKNMDSVSVGGNNRSRWTGSSSSRPSSIYGPMSTLKKA